MMRIGGHFHSDSPWMTPWPAVPAGGAVLPRRPPGISGPRDPYAGGAAALKEDAESAGVGIYVHAPYIVNVATTNNRIRIPSRKLLQQHMDAAAELGARGLIVHGGHVNAADDPAVGFDNWRKAVEATDLKIPLLIENTAGGDNAMARYLDRIKGVFDAVCGCLGLRPGRLLPGHLPCACRRHRAGAVVDGSWRSPAGSTWCTATTAATSSTPVPIGTPTSVRAESIPICSRGRSRGGRPGRVRDPGAGPGRRHQLAPRPRPNGPPGASRPRLGRRLTRRQTRTRRSGAPSRTPPAGHR